LRAETDRQTEREREKERENLTRCVVEENRVLPLVDCVLNHILQPLPLMMCPHNQFVCVLNVGVVVLLIVKEKSERNRLQVISERLMKHTCSEEIQPNF